MQRLRFSLLCALVLGTVTGCAEPLESITDIIKPRVLGALLRVQGDPTRSTPAPGETIEIELVVADPGPRKGRSWVFVVCAPAETQFDVGACETVIGGPFLSPPLPGPEDPKPAPAFTFEVPDEATLGDATELLVLGAVCADGDIDLTFDPSAFQGDVTTANPCVDQEKHGALITMGIPLERASEDRNLIPDFATIDFDGVPWTATAGEADPVDGCAGGPLPQHPHRVGLIPVNITLTEGSRETFVNDRDPPETVVEEPFVAFYATGGEFEGAYSFFDDTPNDPTLEWTMPGPGAIPETGRVIRFHFVLRDRRGGSSAIERAICVLPPPL